MKRREFLKNAGLGSMGLMGLSALNPLLAMDDFVEVKGPAMPDQPFTKVTDRCYYILSHSAFPTPENFGFFSNPGFIVTSEGVVVIDTGGSVQIGEMILRQIKKVTNKPVIMAFNTHYHGDHWLGNHAFVEAYPQLPIYAHPEMTPKIKAGTGEFWRTMMMKATNDGISGTVITPPNKTTNHGAEFKLGDTTLRIHQFGKVHTEVDLMIEVVEDKTLYIGDLAMRRVANMEDGSYQGSIKALDAMLDMDVKHIIPGHGPLDNKQLLLDSKQFLSEVYTKVAEMAEEGMEAYEMKPAIMELDFVKAEVSKWPGYEESIGKFIIVAKLEYEESAF